MITLIRNSRLILSGLILILVYFSQISPFVHIQHSHDDDGLSFETSMYPVDSHLERASDHHEDGHSHCCTFHRSSDSQYLVRRSTTLVTPKQVQVYAALIAELVPADQPICRISDEAAVFSQNPHHRLAVAPRAPPALC